MKLGVIPEQVTCWELGACSPPEHLLSSLISVLDISLEDFLAYLKDNPKLRQRPIHETIRELIHKSGFTERELASLLEVSQSYLNRLKNGKAKTTSLQVFLKLSAICSDVNSR